MTGSGSSDPRPAAGLLVEDLADRRRTLLPPTYLAQHATYGWACTIDGAPGATADLGILLARPGLDREHLYVGMTRGRHANHVHLTTEPADDTHRPRPPGTPPTLDNDVRTPLQTATARVGAQQAVHTLLDRARQKAVAIPPSRPRDPSAPRPTPGRELGPWAPAADRSRHWSSRDATPLQPGRSIGM